MHTAIDLSDRVLLFEELSSKKSKLVAIDELIRVYNTISVDNDLPLADNIESLISWHNNFLSTDDPRFTPDGRYFGNESYFSKFLYLVRNASFRGKYYIFNIPNYPDQDVFFKAETPSPPVIFPWTLVEMKSDKSSILAAPFELEETYRVFETADDLIHAIEILNGKQE